MKIGIDARLWGETGVGRYIRNLVLNLQKLDKKNDYLLFLTSDNYPLVTVPKNWEKRLADVRWHTATEQLKLPRLLNKEDLDLMHFPYFSVPALYNKPYVVTIHDLILHHFATGEASTLSAPLYKGKLLSYKAIVRLAAKKAQKVLTVSEATKVEIMDHLGVNAQNIIVAYEGIDESFLAAKEGQRIVADPYFLHVGNVYPHKNMERLIDAFHTLVMGENRNAKLVIVGKKDYFFDKLNNKIRNLGVDDKVLFMGEITDKELKSLYQHAEALVIPSLMEGFGLPAVEAMALGCLVLASDIQSLHEVCREAAIYIEPYNTEELESILKKTLGAPKEKFKKNISAGLKRAKAFSWEKMAKETLKVYESSIGIRQS